jgi:hypothetical protein
MDAEYRTTNPNKYKAKTINTKGKSIVFKKGILRSGWVELLDFIGDVGPMIETFLLSLQNP